MLSCLGARLGNYKKGEYVLRQGEHLNDIVVLVEGKLHIQKDDYWGNRSILGLISVGEMFGEAYVAPESGSLLNDVVAVEDSTVIFFNVNRIITTCSSACRFMQWLYRICFLPYQKKTENLFRSSDICRSVLHVRSLFHIYLKKQGGKTVQALQFPLTVSNWQIFCLLTEVQCLTSCVRCVMRVF